MKDGAGGSGKQQQIVVDGVAVGGSQCQLTVAINSDLWSSTVVSDKRHGTTAMDGSGRWWRRRMVVDDGDKMDVKVNGKRTNWYKVRRYKIKGEKIGTK